MGNKIDELNKLHSQSVTVDTILATMLMELQANSPGFNYKFKYSSPTNYNIEIELKNGTNRILLNADDTKVLYEFLKSILEEPKQHVEKPKPLKKEDTKV